MVNNFYYSLILYLTFDRQLVPTYVILMIPLRIYAHAHSLKTLVVW